jgi:hypothetical protein
MKRTTGPFSAGERSVADGEAVAATPDSDGDPVSPVPGGITYLVVEASPDGDWEWIAWGGAAGHCYGHGTASTQAAAVEAAEAVAAMLTDTGGASEC